jgi:steroid delta-isomerase-like uncharacterized protein
MSEKNKQLMRRWFDEVWNNKRESAIDEMFAPDGKCHGFPELGDVLVGPEAFKALQRSFCGAFPDISITIEDALAEGDRVAARWSATMTHLGDHLGFPATGRKATLTGSAFAVIRSGQVVEAWNFIDMAHLLQQLKDDSAAPPRG